MKNGSRVLHLWFGKPFGLNWPKTSFKAPDLYVKVYFDTLGAH